MNWTHSRVEKNRLISEFRFQLAPKESAEIPFIFSYSNLGGEVARRVFETCLQNTKLLDETVGAYAELLGRTAIFTPEQVINRGLQWAKVNAVRVQHRYRTGFGFTNDPPQDIIVVRDAAWYVLGSDYLTPEFSKALLELVSR